MGGCVSRSHTKTDEQLLNEWKNDGWNISLEHDGKDLLYQDRNYRLMAMTRLKKANSICIQHEMSMSMSMIHFNWKDWKRSRVVMIGPNGPDTLANIIQWEFSNACRSTPLLEKEEARCMLIAARLCGMRFVYDEERNRAILLEAICECPHYRDIIGEVNLLSYMFQHPHFTREQLTHLMCKFTKNVIGKLWQIVQFDTSRIELLLQQVEVDGTAPPCREETVARYRENPTSPYVQTNFLYFSGALITMLQCYRSPSSERQEAIGLVQARYDNIVAYYRSIFPQIDDSILGKLPSVLIKEIQNYLISTTLYLNVVKNIERVKIYPK